MTAWIGAESPVPGTLLDYLVNTSKVSGPDAIVWGKGAGAVIDLGDPFSLGEHYVLYAIPRIGSDARSSGAPTELLEGTFFLDYTPPPPVVPEPSTYFAGLGALGMLGMFGWKNRK